MAQMIGIHLGNFMEQKMGMVDDHSDVTWLFQSKMNGAKLDEGYCWL
jgi:hypothetical protein